MSSQPALHPKTPCLLSTSFELFHVRALAPDSARFRMRPFVENRQLAGLNTAVLGLRAEIATATLSGWRPAAKSEDDNETHVKEETALQTREVSRAR